MVIIEPEEFVVFKRKLSRLHPLPKCLLGRVGQITKPDHAALRRNRVVHPSNTLFFRIQREYTIGIGDVRPGPMYLGGSWINFEPFCPSVCQKLNSGYRAAIVQRYH